MQAQAKTKFKKTPIGEIPEDWEVVRLGEIVKFQRGYSYRRSDLSETPTNIRFITINEFEKEGGLKKNVEPVYLKETSEIKEKFFLSPGDLLIANTDMTKGFIIGAPLLVTPKLIPETGKAVFSMDLTKLIITDDQVLSEFLFYWLMWRKIRRVMKQFAQGLNVKHLNHDLAKTLVVALPPLPEQKKIAEILRTVDDAIEKTDEAIERTERLKKGLMQRLLTKGIKHERFKKTELGEIPEEWEVLTVGELIKEKIILRIQDGNHGELHPKTHEFSSSGIPFITANCIKNNKLDLSECKFLPDDVVRRLVKGFAKPRDVLLTHKGSIGLTAIVPKDVDLVVLSPQVTYYRVNNEKLRSEFLYYVFQTNYFKRQILPLSKQSTRDYISLERQKRLKLPLPPLEEQKQIAEILSTVDRKLELLRQRKGKLERVKRGLMKDLLTGRKRVKY